jgi:hypothetical protein
MKKTQKRIKVKRSKSIRKKKGGDCGCGLKDPFKFRGGYGTASFPRELHSNSNIIPLNQNISTGSDPLGTANIIQERFARFSAGGKKSKTRRRRKLKKGGGLLLDPILGNGVSNVILGATGSAGNMNIAYGINGQKPIAM